MITRFKLNVILSWWKILKRFLKGLFRDGRPCPKCQAVMRYDGVFDTGLQFTCLDCERVHLEPIPEPGLGSEDHDKLGASNAAGS